jgi:hypothetical protein
VHYRGAGGPEYPDPGTTGRVARVCFAFGALSMAVKAVTRWGIDHSVGGVVLNLLAAGVCVYVAIGVWRPKRW